MNRHRTVAERAALAIAAAVVAGAAACSDAPPVAAPAPPPADAGPAVAKLPEIRFYTLSET